MINDIHMPTVTSVGQTKDSGFSGLDFAPGGGVIAGTKDESGVEAKIDVVDAISVVFRATWVSLVCLLLL